MGLTLSLSRFGLDWKRESRFPPVIAAMRSEADLSHGSLGNRCAREVLGATTAMGWVARMERGGKEGLDLNAGRLREEVRWRRELGGEVRWGNGMHAT